MTPHCEWCADPWRAVILDVTRRGARIAVIARHYGVARTTVAGVVQQARAEGCLEWPVCPYCPTEVTAPGAPCDAVECQRLYERDTRRKQRACYGWRPGWKKGDRYYREAPGFRWPPLPERPKVGRRPPVVMKAPPIRFPAFLRGEGRKRKLAPPANLVTPVAFSPVLGSTWVDPRYRRAA